MAIANALQKPNKKKYNAGQNPPARIFTKAKKKKHFSNEKGTKTGTSVVKAQSCSVIKRKRFVKDEPRVFALFGYINKEKNNKRFLLPLCRGICSSLGGNLSQKR